MPGGKYAPLQEAGVELRHRDSERRVAGEVVAGRLRRQLAAAAMAAVSQPGREASAWSQGVTSPEIQVLPNETLRM